MRQTAYAAVDFAVVYSLILIEDHPFGPRLDVNYLFDRRYVLAAGTGLAGGALAGRSSDTAASRRFVGLFVGARSCET